MDKQARAGEFFRSVLTDVLDDLRDEVPGSIYDETSKNEEVKQSLRNISFLYRTGLSSASSEMRTDWDEAANRCAYVFLYLMQHCNLVFFSLQNSLSEISAEWRYKHRLKVCSIGGGPGSDLVGLTTFLRLNHIFPSQLKCLVLDLYPSWKDTWDRIHSCIPEEFEVAYHRCDVVRDTRVQRDVRQFIQEADMITLVKSFSAMSAFFRAHPSRGEFLCNILRELKPGCFVLYIDNNNSGDTQFQREFATRAGLEVEFESRGVQTVPSGAYSYVISRYCRLLDFSPMRSCDVNIQVFCKEWEAQPRLNPSGDVYSVYTTNHYATPLVFSPAKKPNTISNRFLARTYKFPMHRVPVPEMRAPAVSKSSRKSDDGHRHDRSGPSLGLLMVIVGFSALVAVWAVRYFYKSRET